MADNRTTVAAYQCARCAAVALAQFNSRDTVPATLADECGQCKAAGAKIGGTLALWTPAAGKHNAAEVWTLAAILAPDMPATAGILLKPDEALVVSALRVFSSPAQAARWLTGIARGANGTRAKIVQTAIAPNTIDNMAKLDGRELPLQLQL